MVNNNIPNYLCEHILLMIRNDFMQQKKLENISSYEVMLSLSHLC